MARSAPITTEKHDQLDRDQQAFEHARTVALEELEAHRALTWPRSDQRSMPWMPNDEMIDMTR
jgi:hypothetical protein